MSDTKQPDGPKAEGAPSFLGRLSSLRVRAIGLGVFIVLGCGLCLISEDPNTPTEAGVKMELPDYLDGYVGQPAQVSQAELRMLPGDTVFERMTYHSIEGEQILCSIVLAGGEKRSIHRPEVCLPAQGWTQKSRETIQVALADGRTIDVSLLRVSRPLELANGETIVIPSLFMYFFIGKDILTASHFERVFLTSWDRVIHSVNHRWAYVSVSSAITKTFRPYSGKNEEETLAMLKAFIAEVAPMILVDPDASSPEAETALLKR